MWRCASFVLSTALAALPICSLSTTSAHAAGFQRIEVPADATHPPIPGAMWYPCTLEPGEIDLGAITIPGAQDCPIVGEDLPIIVISHGNLGAFFDHYDTAEALADAGFVVAAIDHRGDNLPTFADAADPSVMFERPSAITRLIDFMGAASPAAPHIDRGRIGFFGFSAGAATGLVLAGADWHWAVVLCRFSPATLACADTLGKNFEVRSPAIEPRIKAAVLADPPGMWLVADSIAEVDLPIQLWASENGGRGLPNIGVTPESVAAVERGLPGVRESHVVMGAGHFAFMLCGPSISPVPEYCADAPSFDRVAFHDRFNADVVRFFQAQLNGA